MKYLLVILSILIFFVSCKDKEAQSVQDYHISKNTINSEEAVISIEAFRDFELEHNQIFQQDLQIKSKEYYDNLIETFIDEKTGFFKLFGELRDRVFKSENERKILWKLKIERYFRTTAFLTYIRNEVTIYTDGVNNQRNNGISKILGTKYSSNLNLPIVEANSFYTKNESVEKIISKINDEITDQLADVTLGFIPEIILLAVGGLLGIGIGIKFGWLPTIIFMVVLAILFMWRSSIRQNEMRNILKTECYKTLNSTKIDYLDQLNKNTIQYYSQLQKINYETNK